MRKILSVVFTLFFVFGFTFSALPTGALAEEEKKAFGCCQFIFDGEPGGCMYPSDPDSCAGGKLKGEYIDGVDCNIDTGFCEGYEKDKKDKS